MVSSRRWIRGRETPRSAAGVSRAAARLATTLPPVEHAAGPVVAAASGVRSRRLELIPPAGAAAIIIGQVTRFPDAGPVFGSAGLPGSPASRNPQSGKLVLVMPRGANRPRLGQVIPRLRRCPCCRVGASAETRDWSTPKCYGKRSPAGSSAGVGCTRRDRKRNSKTSGSPL